jgi:protein TonB
MRHLAFTHSDSHLPSVALPRSASVLKVMLVIGLHAGLLAAALHATGVITRSAVPLPMSLMTVMIAAPAKPVTPTALPKPAQVIPRLPSARLALPDTPPLSHASPVAVSVSVPATALAPAMTPVIAAQAVAPALTEASFDAAYLNNPAPVYPLMSRRNGEAGKVLLLVQVSKQGTAAQVEIKQSCGFARLDEAALEAVRKWRFIPARRGEEVIAASVVVPLTFRLNS